MLDTGIENVNYFAAAILTMLVNAAVPALVAIALVSLLAWHKGWNAATRYCAWWLMLAFLVALPFVPRIERSAAPPAIEYVGTAPNVLPAEPAAAVLTSIPVLAPEQPLRNKALPSPVTVFLFCWAAASCLQLVRLLRGFAYGIRIKHGSTEAPEDVQALFGGLLARTGTRRRVSLGLSEDVATPALLGYFRPQVLLPAALTGHLDRSELEQVLLHELAHVARWDDWSIVLQRMVEAIGVFHPLVAYLAYRMNLDREMACDDRVTSLCEPHEYASCLTRIAEIRHFGSAAPVTVPLLLESKSELLTRVESLLDSSRAHMPRVSVTRVLAVCACAATVGVAAAFTPRLLPAPATLQPAMELQAAPQPPLPAKAIPPEPQEPPAPAAPQERVAPPRSPNSISSITVTGENGSSSNFGSWSEDEKREPDTITFDSGGKRYIIRDRATVEEASGLLRPMQELGHKQGELGKQQAALGEKQRALGEKQMALVQAPLDPATMRHLQEQLRDLESKLHGIDIEKELKTAQEAMERLGDLQSKLGEMQSHMAAAQGLMGEKQGLLGEEQGKLGEQQGRLGQMQGQLGEQQAREAKRIERRLQELIRRAQERGLAQPVH
jgi:bla regulator protein blaR1